MYVVIRRYEGLDARALRKMADRSSEALVRRISQIPGFIAHYAALAEDGALLGINIFDGRDGAEASTRLVQQWIEEHWGAVVSDQPRVTMAEVVASLQPA